MRTSHTPFPWLACLALTSMLVMISSEARLFCISPWTKPETHSFLEPPGPTMLMLAPSAERTVGRSDAGSEWARLPPIVPRLRTAGSPIMPAASASIGQSLIRMSDEAMVAWVVSEEIVIVPSLHVTPLLSSPRWPMSTSSAGEASRSFISGIRLCPPASTFASSFPARSDTASCTEPARWYSVCVAYMAYPPFCA